MYLYRQCCLKVPNHYHLIKKEENKRTRVSKNKPGREDEGENISLDILIDIVTPLSLIIILEIYIYIKVTVVLYLLQGFVIFIRI